MPSIIIRPRQTLPPHTRLSDTVCVTKKHVEIKHLGYDEGENDLLILFAPNGKEGGLQIDLVRIACGIVAGNRFDGFLSSSRLAQALDLSRDDILQPRTYYFHVPYSKEDQ